MGQYSVYDDKHIWLYDITADSAEEAVVEAKKGDPRAFRAELVREDDDPPMRGRSW